MTAPRKKPGPRPGFRRGVNPETGKRWEWEARQAEAEAAKRRAEQEAAEQAERAARAAAEHEATMRRLALLKRQQVAVRARDHFMTYIRFTSPDPEAPDDVTRSAYRNARHHDAVAKALEEVVAGNITFLILVMPPRHGKALALDTPVATPSGWTTMGDLKPGDMVFDETGTPTRVVAKSPVWKDRPVFRVTTDDGHSLIADENHEWLVRLCRKRPVFKVKTTRQLASRTCDRNPMLPAVGALDLPVADLPIDPYVLGVWLGDGCSGHATITASDADAAFIRAEIERRGVSTSDRGTAQTFGLLGLYPKLRDCGLLRNKHVPKQYLRASRKQRLDLLRGLIDTDGHVAPDGQVEFCNVRRDLALAVRELVHSLGYKASLVTGRATLDGKDCGEKYRVLFYAPDAALLPRKASRCVTPKNGRFIRFEPAGRADTVCIEVEAASHLFLAGEGMIPTHNSEQTSRKLPAWFMGKFPHLHGVVATYNDDFAMDFGKEVRSITMTAQHRQVFPDFALQRGGAASDRLKTREGGQWSFVGRGGSLTGRGAHITIIDDLIKDDKEAQSAAIRDQAWNWFTKVAMTRRMGQKLVVMTFTRWHADDPIGRLTDPENPHFSAKLSKRIKIIKLAAIAGEDDPLGRKPGEALWPDGPDRFDLDFLEEQRELDPVAFQALYQQEPSLLDGDLFRREDIQFYDPDELPAELRIYCASDHAVTKTQRSDYTVLLKAGVDRHNNIYLLECDWRRMTSDVATEAMLNMARGRHRPLIWWAENGHISKSIGPFLRKRMTETGVFFPIREMTPSADKVQRAQSIAGRVATGRVFFPRRAPWTERALNELMAFPNSRHDDFVDALSWLGIGLQSQFGPAAAAGARAREQAPEFGTLAWVKQMDAWKRQQAETADAGGF